MPGGRSAPYDSVTVIMNKVLLSDFDSADGLLNQQLTILEFATKTLYIFCIICKQHLTIKILIKVIKLPLSSFYIKSNKFQN